MASEAIANNIERDRLLVNDDITSEESRYILLQILWNGGYGIVFLSQNSEKNLTVKMEKYSESTLHIEVNGCQHRQVQALLLVRLRNM